MLITMSYSGNLKASFVRKEHERRTETLDEMVDRDLTVHTAQGLYTYFDAKRSLSPLHERLACQIEKKKSVVHDLE